MIVVLEEVRSNRIMAIRALRTLNYSDPEYENNIQRGGNINPGLKEAKDMVDSLPLSFWILPEDLPLFEEHFVVRTRQPALPPREPRAYIYHPNGILEVRGDAKDLADAIYRVLAHGYPRDKVFVMMPGPSA